MGALIVLFLLLIATASWVAFTLGRVTADRRASSNHHQMMAMLVNLQSRDDIVPIMTSEMRTTINHLLNEYQRFDLDA